MKVLLIAAGCVVVTFSLILGLAVLGAADSASASSANVSVCITTGPIAGLSSTSATNARIVTAVAERTVGTAGAVVAVTVGDTESGLRILGNPLVGLGGVIAQGTGSDHDSLGIFQQRASWGTVAQRLDPEISTGLFVARLKELPGWATEEPWIAAQKIQQSAWDGTPRTENQDSAVYGGNYKAHLALARHVVAAIDSDAAKLACGALHGSLPASSAAGSHGLPTAYLIPQTATPTEARVVAFAISQLDKPYVFGAAGPDAYDCSGLTVAAWRRVGVDLPHDAATQSQDGVATTTSALVPGDLVFVPGDDGTLAAPGHVGIYIGSGLVLNAADEQVGIRVQTYRNFLQVGHGLAALRHLG